MPDGDGGTPPPAAPPSSPAQPAAPVAAPAGSIPPPVTPTAPPAKGSAKSRMFGELGKLGDKGATPPAAPAPAAPKAEPPVVEPRVEPKDKPNPWKLYEESKTKIKEYEGKVAELEKLRITPERQKEIEQLNARADELEKEIRYVNYTKSKEFQEQYQRPYDDAWKRAMGDLGELTVASGDGGERSMTAGDILDLVNLPLGEARKLAVERFGDFADDVMQHRKEIRQLYDKQSARLEEVKGEGIERDKQRQVENQRRHLAATKEINDTWNQANESLKTHEKYGAYFKEVDGDQEGNQRLAKGFALADRAFSENPMAPGLKPEDRKAIVERHAAVRNRAAAFGRLVFRNQQKDARIAELAKELEGYKQAEPPGGGGGAPPPKGGAAAPRRGMAGLHDAMVKKFGG